MTTPSKGVEGTTTGRNDRSGKARADDPCTAPEVEKLLLGSPRCVEDEKYHSLGEYITWQY